MRVFIAAIAMTATLPALSLAADIMVNVPALMTYAKRDVGRAAGKPDRCEPIPLGERCSYKGGKLVVGYERGSVSSLEINAILPFGPEALPRLGLKPVKPQTSESGQLVWSGGLEAEQETAQGSTMMIFNTVTMTAGPDGKTARVTVR